MMKVLEINEIEALNTYRQQWRALLAVTPGATFFQSLEWLETYWRHFGTGQKLRVLMVFDDEQLIGILPLVVRIDTTRVGRLRVLTFPLDHWWSAYGPIGTDSAGIVALAAKHIQQTPRDWDFFELRWLDTFELDPSPIHTALKQTGFTPYISLMDHSAVVDIDGNWATYWASRKGSWLRRFRHAERELNKMGKISYRRYRPQGEASDDASPCWEMYETCEEIARHSWQASAHDGTTLSHESVRNFLREVHAVAASAGAVDMNLLLIDNTPVAFIYGYYWAGRVIGLRRGYDATKCNKGAGTILLAYTLRDSFQRGDRLYDMGVGSLETKRHFKTRLLPVLRMSCFPRSLGREQLLHIARWYDSLKLPESIAVGCE